jgi:hypothetical protein
MSKPQGLMRPERFGKLKILVTSSGLEHAIFRTHCPIYTWQNCRRVTDRDVRRLANVQIGASTSLSSYQIVTSNLRYPAFCALGTLAVICLQSSLVLSWHSLCSHQPSPPLRKFILSSPYSNPKIIMRSLDVCDKFLCLCGTQAGGVLWNVSLRKS